MPKEPTYVIYDEVAEFREEDWRRARELMDELAAISAPQSPGHPGQTSSGQTFNSDEPIAFQPHPGAQARFMASPPPRMVWSAKLGCFVEKPGGHREG